MLIKVENIISKPKMVKTRFGHDSLKTYFLRCVSFPG